MVIFIISIVVLIVTLTIGGVINSKEPYACPNCGHVFTKKWYSLLFEFGPMVKEGNGKLKLKCPSCKKTDFCQHTKRPHNL